MNQMLTGGQCCAFLNRYQGNYDIKTRLNEETEDETVKYVKSEDSSLKGVELPAKIANEIVLCWLSATPMLEKVVPNWVAKRMVLLCDDAFPSALQEKISSTVKILLENEPEPAPGKMHLLAERLYDAVADKLGKEESTNKELLEILNAHITQTFLLPESSIWNGKIRATALKSLEKALVDQFRYYQHAYGKQVTILLRERFPNRIPLNLLYIHDKV